MTWKLPTSTACVVVTALLGVSTSVSWAEGADSKDVAVSIKLAPLKRASDRVRLWDALSGLEQRTKLTIPSNETPELAVRGRCGSAPSDLLDVLYRLNPGLERSATAIERVVDFIPCPFWYFGNDGSRPRIPVKAGEKLEDLLPSVMGSNKPDAVSRVIALNRQLLRPNGEVRSAGELTVPYVARSLRIKIDSTKSTTSSPESILKSLSDALPANVKSAALSSIEISPSKYHLVGADAPTLLDSAASCNRSTLGAAWPIDISAIASAVAKMRSELGTTSTAVILVADTGVDLRIEKIRNQLWTNSAVAKGFPSPTNFRKDLHGASMVTRNGDDINFTPTYEFGQHGTSVVQIILEPSARNPSLLGLAQVAIAKVNDEVAPYSIELNSIPSAFAYARSMSADVLSLSVVIGAPVDALLQGLRSANYLVVAAAGNNNAWLEQQSIFPPALSDVRENLVVVGASDWAGNIAEFSNRGPLVDILAPGCGIPVPSLDGSEKIVSGTSFSVPFVSYTAALLRAVGVPSSVTTLKTRILASGDFDPNLTGLTRYGVRLNIERAVRVTQDSILMKDGKTTRFGRTKGLESWTCDVHGVSRSFNARQVYKIIPGYPGNNTSSAKIWARPPLGGIVEVMCDGPLDQTTISFKKEGETDFEEVNWSDIVDFAPRLVEN